MAIIGKVESLWRYPVKSMRGEELSEAFVGFAGVYGDRLFAFRSAGRPSGFPYLTGREQMKMVLYPPFPPSRQGREATQLGRGGEHRAWAEPDLRRSRGPCRRRGNAIG